MRWTPHTSSFRDRRHGLLIRNLEHGYLNLAEAEEDEAAMEALRAHSITYRIALGPQEGRKVRTLQTLRPSPRTARVRWPRRPGSLCTPGWDGRGLPMSTKKLERLCRYIARPAVSTERLSLTAQGHIHYRLKTPYRVTH